MLAKAIRQIQKFIQLEAAGGIVLFFGAIIAIGFANSPLNSFYNYLLNLHFHLGLGHWYIEQSLLHWVNDGLMAIFFLIIGLEIKREIVAGELNSLAKLALPGFAALGGMLMPALIYLIINQHDPIALRGWAIPTATDIAFALGLLSLFGSKIPYGLKIFLTTLAILDDLGAIIIIATFYTEHIFWLYLAYATIAFFILILLNLLNIKYLTPYLILGMLLWYFIFRSGIHATVAGVALAMTIPLRIKNNPKASPLIKLEKSLHPWVAFIILPIFAFFNAGVSFIGLNSKIIFSLIPLGIICGLFFGKQLGVFFSSFIAVKLKIAKMTHGMNFSWLYGVSVICGIGFTMSLFIGNLAFETINQEYILLVKLGVIMGSLLSGVVGYALLLYLSRRYRVRKII